MSTVEVTKESLPDGFQAGNGTIGETESPVSAIDWPIRKHVVIRAHMGNTGNIFVGTAGNAANGFILAEGETTPPIQIDQLHKIAIVASAADQDYSWLLI